MKHRVDFVLNEETERLLQSMVKHYGDMTAGDYFRRAIDIGLSELITMYLEELDDEKESE